LAEVLFISTDSINGRYVVELSIKEVQLLYDFLKTQYVSYENAELLTLLRELRIIVDELARNSGESALRVREP